MSALSTAQHALASDETDLVAAVRRSDDGAFGELYSRYGRRITAYVLGMVGDHGRAEDITQEVFISALRRMRKTDRPIAFKPWIYEIARNACIDEFRRVKRNQEVPLASDEDDSEGAGRRLVSGAQTPDVALERRQQMDDLRGAFRGLSDNHHKIIVLRELEGLSYTEIGERLGMTRPVVESTLFRARRRLSEEYEEIASGQRCEQVHAVVSGGEKSLHSRGIRERRRVARHVSHCQPCRRYAHSMGLDDSAFHTPGLAEKIAALLPIPAFLRWRRSGGHDKSRAATGSHSFSALQSMQNVAQYADPASPGVGLGRAAAAVAAVVIAGGGVVGGLSATAGTSAPHHKAPAVIRSGGSRVAAGSRSVPGNRAARANASAAAGAARANSASAGAKTSTGAAQANHSSRPAGSTASVTHSSGTGSSSASGSTRSGSGVLAGGSLPKLPLPKVTVPALPVPQVHLPGLPSINLPALPGSNTVKGVTGAVTGAVGGLLGKVTGH